MLRDGCDLASQQAGCQLHRPGAELRIVRIDAWRYRDGGQRVFLREPDFRHQPAGRVVIGAAWPADRSALRTLLSDPRGITCKFLVFLQRDHINELWHVAEGSGSATPRLDVAEGSVRYASPCLRFRITEPRMDRRQLFTLTTFVVVTQRYSCPHASTNRLVTVLSAWSR